MNKAYCQTCNAPKTDGVAILMRCGLCVVQNGKPPTKYALQAVRCAKRKAADKVCAEGERQ